jgi:hypothetical protein
MGTRRVVAAFVAGVSLLATPAVASAGAPLASNMVATPDPATTEDTITIANGPSEADTCEAPFAELTSTPTGILLPVVYIDIFGPSGDGVLKTEAEPDANGDWSVTVGPFDEAGTYTAEATCEWDELLKFATPARSADFSYEPLEFEVTQVAPTPTAPATTAAPTTTAAAAAAATAAPRFTG